MKTVDLTGKRFGRLFVESFYGLWTYPSGKTRRLWQCKCDCGNTINVRANDLVSGHTQSCGCLNNDKKSQRKFKNLSGKTIGHINVIKRIGTKTKTSKTSTPVYLCKCLLCGNLFCERADYLQSGDVSSCGCFKKKKESKIEKILLENKIDYTYQTTFTGLLSPAGYPLWFDFAIWDNNGMLLCVIEEQGIQHTSKSNRIKDEIKKSFCREHNIILEDIWWHEDIEIRMKEIIEKYSHANPVPSFFEKEGATTISKESTRLVKFQRGSAMLQKDFLDEDIV